MMSYYARTNMAVLYLETCIYEELARGGADGAHGFEWWVTRVMGLIELPLEGKPSPLLNCLASTSSWYKPSNLTLSCLSSFCSKKASTFKYANSRARLLQVLDLGSK